jgi:hypothetical protein
MGAQRQSALAHDWWTPAAAPKLKREEARCQPRQSHLLLALKTIEKQALFANSWNAKRCRIARINTFLSF